MPRFLDELRDDYLRCRTLGHAWDDVPHPLAARGSIAQPPTEHRFSGKSGWWELYLRCTRCKTIRQDTIDARGAVQARRYIYSLGYQRPGGGVLKRPQLRIELKVRVAHDVKALLKGGR